MGQCCTANNNQQCKDVNDMDIEIFEQIKTECKQSQTEIISNCSFLERLVTGLKYFNVSINDKNINYYYLKKHLLSSVIKFIVVIWMILFISLKTISQMKD